MKYSLKYRGPTQWFSRTYKNITGDLISPDLPNTRILFLEDQTRLELPHNGATFIWSPNRFLIIAKNMEKEAGQKLPLNT